VKEKILPLLLIGALLLRLGFVGISLATENKGAEIILINGGKARDIHFPHHRHQTALENCDICHTLFPKKVGGIAELKAQGKLKKKQVMQEHCIDCHKKMRAEGRKTGPRSCARCHRPSG
jgi:hypothetical protein